MYPNGNLFQDKLEPTEDQKTELSRPKRAVQIGSIIAWEEWSELISEQGGVEKSELRGIRREDWSRREWKSEKWGGTGWIKKIGYERSEKGGTKIENQNKKSEADLE